MGCPRMLGVEDRAAIMAGVDAGLSQVRIAHLIGRSPSVVCREIARHTGPDGQYRADEAGKAARAARHRPKKRLATARALYKKPGLLVLDEPTASVDAVSEKAMFEALTAIDYQLTILLVAHRFTTICHAEKIIVLDGGKVVGCGDHATLLKSCKFYADMFHAQNSYN